MAYLQARWQISVMSAPEKPLVCFTSRSTSTSGATGDFRSTACQRTGSSMRGITYIVGVDPSIDEDMHLCSHLHWTFRSTCCCETTVRRDEVLLRWISSNLMLERRAPGRSACGCPRPAAGCR